MPSRAKIGRPKGATKLVEAKNKTFSIRVTRTAYKWLKSKPLGWLGDWVETQARKERKKKGNGKNDTIPKSN